MAKDIYKASKVGQDTRKDEKENVCLKVILPLLEHKEHDTAQSSTKLQPSVPYPLTLKKMH